MSDIDNPNDGELVGKMEKSESAGALIRKAREAQGLHIAMLAVTLKVPVKKLEALEADRFDDLPDMVFVRALASSVCRALKIDDSAVMSALPPSSKPYIKSDESGLNTVLESSDSVWLANAWSQLKKPQIAAIFFLVLGIVSVFLLPLGSSEADLADNSVTTPLQDQNGAVVVLPIVPVSDAVVSNVVAVESLPASSAIPNIVSGMPVSSASSSVSVKQVVDLGPVASVTLQAKGPTWVEVVDASGVLQIRRTLVENDDVSLSGLAPLKVILGRADLVVASTKGQSIDLSAFTKDNVARFEVNP